MTSGVRYILGAFLLLEDRVEHVRRLKNRGADLRKNGKLDEAIKHFEWALAINPKCTTCKSFDRCMKYLPITYGYFNTYSKKNNLFLLTYA